MSNPFWVRSVRRRPTAFVSLLLLSSIAMVVSVLAPLLLRSVQEVTLSEASVAAGSAGTAIVASADVSPGESGGGYSAALGVVLGFGDSPNWMPPITAVQTSSAYDWATRDGVPHASIVTGLGNPCTPTTAVDGRCPRSADEVMLARVTARDYSVSVGQVIRLSPDAAHPTPLTVVGIYDETRGYGRFIASPADATVPTTTNLVVTLSRFDQLESDGTAYSMRLLRHPLTLESVPAVRKDVARAHAAVLLSQSATFSAEVATGVLGVVDRIQPQHDAAAILLAVSAIEALALAWFAEGLVIQRIGRVRALEWGLARLRGLPRRRWLAAVFLEPLVALVVGALGGFGLALVVATAAARAVLGRDAPIDPSQPLVFLAAGLAIAGSLVALCFASLRSARLPLATLIRQTTEPRRLSRLGVIAQTAIVLATGVVIYSLVTQNRITGPQVALLAPSLVALLLGVVGLRIAVGVIRAQTRRPPRSLFGVVIGRQLGRAPSVLYVAVMVSVGISIAVYSSQVGGLATRLQFDRARASLGASTVLTATVPAGVDFLGAVRRADPTGTRAMAAEVYDEGSGVGRLVAVDSSRLSAVSSWDPRWSGTDAAGLRHALSPSTGTSLTIAGTSLSLTLAGVSAAKIPADQRTLSLDVVVQNSRGWHLVTFGAPRDGVLTTPSGALPCAEGCRLVWLGERSTGAAEPPFSTQLTITAIATDRHPASEYAKWLKASHWRNHIGSHPDATGSANGAISDASAGLHVVFSDSKGNGAPSIATTDAPEPLPALLGPETKVNVFAGIPQAVVGIGPDLDSLLLRDIGHAAILPRVLGTGAMVDYELADRVSDPSKSAATREVWLAPGDHSAILAALKSERVKVTGERRLVPLAAQYQHEAPARAAVLGETVGATACLLLFIVLVSIRLVESSSRRRQWRSLARAGIAASRLRRLAAFEFAAPAVAGVALGTVAGILAVIVTAPKLPLLAGDGVTPPPDLSVAPAPVAMIAIGAAIVVVVIGIVGAAFERPGSGPS